MSDRRFFTAFLSALTPSITTTALAPIGQTGQEQGRRPRLWVDRFSPTGYAVGVNIVIDAMTH